MKRNGLGVLSLLVTCSMIAALLVMAGPAVADEDRKDCPGDLNGDGVVDVFDLLIVLDDFGCEGDCEGDANGDGVVDALDVVFVLMNFGPCDDAEACETHADCDDGDPCTINFCFEGACMSAPNPHPDCQ